MAPKGGILPFRWHKKLGWWLVGVLCFIPVWVWLSYLPLGPRISGLYGFVGFLGKVTGIVGMMLYSINLILATRLRIFENLFGGLNRMYIAHHIIGGLALILLVFHPLFLSLRYLTISLHQAAIELLPVLTQVDRSGWARNFGIISLFGMVLLLIITFFAKLPYRLWFFTHRFLGVFFFVGGLHVFLVSSDTNTSGFLRWYMLGFALVGTVAYAYRSLLGRILIRKYHYIVKQVLVVGGNVAQVVMEPAGRTLSFEAGQFMFIRFKSPGQKSITSEWHPFSISSAPGEEFLRIDAKVLGDYTKALMDLKPGAQAEIEGAYGRFSYQNYDNPNQIWVAGGIGITPFLSMARSLKGKNHSANLHIDMYYSVKAKEELVDYGTLHSVAYFNPKIFRLFPHVSKDNGMLTAEIIAQKSGGVAGKDIYICGPPPMMKAMKEQFVRLGVPKKNIHSEEFSMS